MGTKTLYHLPVLTQITFGKRRIILRPAGPRLGLAKSHTDNNVVSSTYWMRNGNFLRFKTLEIGYRFKYGRIYLTGDNLAVFSPFKEWDPELEWYKYPLQRTFNVGLQLNF